MGSLAAAHVTALFNYEIERLCTSKNIKLEAHLLATFDCRLGSYATFEEALSLIFWRAYDSGINGVSDRIHQLKGEFEGDAASARKVAGDGNNGEKLVFLHKLNLLPLPTHQAYGAFYARVQRLRQGTNPKT